jgi:hypothetical protein
MRNLFEAEIVVGGLRKVNGDANRIEREAYWNIRLLQDSTTKVGVCHNEYNRVSRRSENQLLRN